MLTADDEASGHSVEATVVANAAGDSEVDARGAVGTVAAGRWPSVPLVVVAVAVGGDGGAVVVAAAVAAAGGVGVGAAVLVGNDSLETEHQKGEDGRNPVELAVVVGEERYSVEASTKA